MATLPLPVPGLPTPSTNTSSPSTPPTVASATSSAINTITSSDSRLTTMGYIDPYNPTGAALSAVDPSALINFISTWTSPLPQVPPGGNGASWLAAELNLNPSRGNATSRLVSDLNLNPGSLPAPGSYISPIGVPVTMVALLPSPGTSLPTIPATTPASAHVLPATAVLSVRWAVKVEDADGTAVEVRPGIEIHDTGAAYQVVEGNLSSTSLTIVPWPSNDFTTSACRKFSVDLKVTIWWPGMSDSESLVLFSMASFSVPPWSTVFQSDGSDVSTLYSNIGTSPLATTPQTLDPTLYLRDLVKVSIDTAAPEAGKAVNILIQQNNKSDSSSLPRIVQSITQQEPNFQVQAALELSGWFNGILTQANTAAKSAGIQLSESAIENVQNILNSLLSIPVALAVNGSNVTKTLLPNANDVLSSAKFSNDVSTIVGRVPIGSLMANLTIDLQHLIFSAQDKSSGNDVTNQFKQGASQSGLGLSLIPIPKLSAYSDNPVVQTVTISVKVSATLELPGAAPHKIHLAAPSFDITVPTIQIPQVFMGFHDSNYQGSDVYWSLDPYSRDRIPDSKSLLGWLGSLSATFNLLVLVLPSDFMSSAGQSDALLKYDRLCSVINKMTAALAKNQTQSVYTQDYNPKGWPNCYECRFDSTWWEGSNSNFADHNKNLSSFLWIGAPFVNGDWRLMLLYDDFDACKAILAMPFGQPTQTQTPIARSNVYAFEAKGTGDLSYEDAVVFNNFDNGPELGRFLTKDAQIGYHNSNTWNDKIRGLVWTLDRIYWRLNTNPESWG